MDLIAYALRAEHVGTVEQDGEQVPKFGGGVLFVGDGDFHLRDELQAGDGVITVRASDSALVALLDAVPVLKRATPNPDHVVSPYTRKDTDTLRFHADLRGLQQSGSLSRNRLIKALDAHDVAQAEDQTATIAAPEPDEDQGTGEAGTDDQGADVGADGTGDAGADDTNVGS